MLKGALSLPHITPWLKTFARPSTQDMFHPAANPLTLGLADKAHLLGVAEGPVAQKLTGRRVKGHTVVWGRNLDGPVPALVDEKATVGPLELVVTAGVVARGVAGTNYDETRPDDWATWTYEENENICTWL